MFYLVRYFTFYIIFTYINTIGIHVHRITCTGTFSSVFLLWIQTFWREVQYRNRARPARLNKPNVEPVSLRIVYPLDQEHTESLP
uniref:Putative secreted protein n=1 Tax=Anopheles darlingi TaxID=43151 RepID=A0A2M4DGD5_ANODA